MKQVDLIIDALDRVINACKLYDRQDIQDGGTVYLEQELEASIKALAAARELKALKPKAYLNISGYFYIKVPQMADPSYFTPLYALDEVKHD